MVTKQLQFLDIVNFSRRFSKNFADIVAPLNHLYPSKDKKMSMPPWDDTAEHAFKIKGALTNAAFLTHPNPTASLVLMSDASSAAMGVVLQQLVNNSW
ncbi:hypothetical protein MRX96_046505 [Rhipicephalus microplus]